MLTRAQIREASRMLDSILKRIYDGTLSSDGPVAAALVRRLEGATAILRAVVGKRKKG